MQTEMPIIQSQLEQNYPMVDGISRMLVPLKSENIALANTVISLGVYNEFVTSSAAQSYNSFGLGFSIGMHHKIRDIWLGGIELRWSDWMSKSTTRSDLSPLSIYSKIQVYIPTDFILNQNVRNIIKPYATAGLGYTFFYNRRSVLDIQTNNTLGQFSMTYGAGLTIKFQNLFSIKPSFEYWRGIQTSEFKAGIYRLETLFGDVENI